jgi:RsiW-degrading membrane proteinase PrsW (M82 family)
VLATVRWLLPATLPCVLFALHVRRMRRREPPALLVGTFVFGAMAAAAAALVVSYAEALTGLDVRVAVAGPSGALVFVFLVVAPLQQAVQAAATWPAFLSRHFDEPSDGVVYAAASALGFSAVQTATVIHRFTDGPIWIARALLAVPADLFCACLWGYALGRARHSRERLPLFPAAFVCAVAVQGFYEHFVYGRAPGALLAVLPLLAAMAAIAWLIGRDLRTRGERAFSIPSSRLARLAPPPSLTAVRAALRSADDEPVRIGWIALGALVTLGAMITGVAAGVLAAHALKVDLSTVDEHEVAAAAPVLLLGVGLLASFPASGWLVARAASAHSLLEPALAAALALGITLVVLGIAAPFTVVFAIALSPIAWVLSCAGAWVGRDF